MRTILLLLIFCTTFIACQDDDNETISFEKGAKKRVKQITGENSVWGKYRLNFTYDKEGNFLKAWRLNAETGDTTGVITVDYDLNYHFFRLLITYPNWIRHGFRSISKNIRTIGRIP